MTNARLFHATVGVLLIALCGEGRIAAARQGSERTSHPIIAYERARAAAVHKRDVQAYKQLASPALTIVNPDGTLIGRNERLEEVRLGQPRSRPNQVDEYLNTRVFGDLALVSGRSSWRHPGSVPGQEYFLRVWAESSGGWHLVAAHYTDVPRKAQTPSLSRPPSVLDRAEPIIVRDVDPGRASREEVLHALREQHRLYWQKDTTSYSEYVGDDVLRIAEQGVRTKADLIDSSRNKLLHPRAPSPQVDERVHIVGNAATVIWRDAGMTGDGRPTQSWITMVFVKRASKWQFVQMHSTPIRPERAIPVR